jgi:cell division inhibitor SulA
MRMNKIQVQRHPLRGRVGFFCVGRELSPEKVCRWQFWSGPDKLLSHATLKKSVRDGVTLLIAASRPILP